MGIESTLSGFNPIKGVPPGETFVREPTDLQQNMPWGDYGGYDTPDQRAIANQYGPEYAWGNAGKLQPMVVPPQFNMPGAPSTQQFANTTYQSPWNVGGISGLASGPNRFIPQPTGGGQPMLDLLARQRETYNPLLAGLGQPADTPPTIPEDPGGEPVKEPIDTPPGDGGGGIDDYFERWRRDNPDYFEDLWEEQGYGQRGEFPFDINDYVTQQDFMNYQSGIPSLDTSNYMTNQQFQDYMGEYDPNVDLSNYVTQNQLPDYSQYITQNQLPDYSQYVTQNQLPDYSQYVTQNQLPDYSQYVTQNQLPDYSQYVTQNQLPDYSQYVTQNQLPDYNQFITQNSLNTALQGLGSLNTPNPGTASQPYSPFSYR